ncbi:MAG: nucleotidyltransferase family protein [Prevotella sp.]
MDIAEQSRTDNMYDDTEVELHHRPTLMRNLFDDKRLQQWCDSFGADTLVMTDKGFAVPSLDFNRIFILTHIYRHFLFEGIGLRQLMDYYFVLRNVNLNLDGESYLNLNKLLRELRLMRFAAAVMWVLGHVFGLEREYMLCEPDEKEGRFILDEIMQTGNFGQGDRRYKGYGKMHRMSRHGLHLLMHYPSEVI